MPSAAHVPDLAGREKRSLASQCIKTKKFSVLRLLKKQTKITRYKKKKTTTEEITASSAASWVYSGQ